ncbi:MAG: thiamine-phosphate kinase [Chloroflexi bacterium]|nr:thiamine-phosphate kinase [Chloroflexota bacterium]
MHPDERSAHAPISESDLVEIIKQRVNGGVELPEGEVGVGDDAAVLRFDADHIVLTADAMVDGVHFLSESMTWHDIGWKCIVSNQSDIAAMGAQPEHAVLTLAIPATTRVGDLDEILSGVIGALDRYGGRLVGGDTVSSDRIIIGVSMTGRLMSKEQPLRRDTARPGDLVAVTGPLGGSAGGLMAMTQATEGMYPVNPDDEAQLLNAHCRPNPRVDLAGALVKFGAKCAMDVSDGLLLDLERICVASGVDAVVNSSLVPIEPALERAYPRVATELALTGGEDYELVYVTDADTIANINAAQPSDRAADFGIVGKIIERQGIDAKVTVLDESRRELEFDAKGWDHFAR